jgi:bacterioferritin-associated ferredoxin
MYLCVCNAIRDRDACAHVKSVNVDCPSVAMIYRALGVKPKCGKCVPLVRQLLRQATERQQPQPAPALG